MTDIEVLISFNHYRLADVSIFFGALTVATGVTLLLARWVRLKPNHIRLLRLIHLTLGIVTGIYGILTYLTPP